MLISFANTKGGTGKSTLASHLAIWLHDRGLRVSLLDADPQATSSNWVANAEPKILVRAAHDAEGIQHARRELAAHCDVIVADTPGANTEASQVIALLSDLAIVPLQPSKPDLRAIKDSLKFIRVSQEVSGRPEVILVLTFTAKGDLQTKRLRAQLADLGLPIAKSEVRRLNAFRDACDSSVARMQTKDAVQAASDLESLFTEIIAPRLFVGTGVESLANIKEKQHAG